MKKIKVLRKDDTQLKLFTQEVEELKDYYSYQDEVRKEYYRYLNEVFFQIKGILFAGLLTAAKNDEEFKELEKHLDLVEIIEHIIMTGYDLDEIGQVFAEKYTKIIKRKEVK